MSVQNDAFEEPFQASVNGPVVVILGPDSVAVALTPEAIFKSLDGLRTAAEQALANREAGIGVEDLDD